jgi:PIN domain nuclease of toxin-antitoxin system
MILLLDTHSLLWWFADDPQLAAPARRSIADPLNDVLVSAASVWEIEVKRAAGRLEAPEDLLAAIASAGFDTIPLTGQDVVDAARLPRRHGDPFDRMVIAQARRLEAVIVSHDRAFAAYDVHVLGA